MSRPGVRAAGYGWFVPRIVLPLFDRARGRKLSARLRQLRQDQWRSSDALEAAAVVRLQRLLEHAVTHVPYYRRLLGEAGVRPAAIRSLADLSRVPVTTRAALKTAGLAATSADNLGPGRAWRMMSSGSTGMPFTFHADLAAEDTRIATFMLALEWAGAGMWDVEIKATSPFADAPWKYPAPGPVARVGRRILFGRRSARLMESRPTPEGLERLVREVAGRRPWYLRGNPSILAPLADRILRAGVKLSAPPKAILSRGETLTAVRRETIATAFGRPVADHYACAEVAHVAQTCPAADGLHVLGDRMIVRVVDEKGAAVAPGEQGRVLLTDLENHVMPFINYAVGDRAVAGGPCECGRGLPVLTALDGREAEVIRLPGGDPISTYTVDSFLRRHCDVRFYREYQIVQTTPDRVEVRIVATPEFTHRVADKLRQEFEAFLGDSIAVRIAEVEDIPCEPSGKRLAIKSGVPA